MLLKSQRWWSDNKERTAARALFLGAIQVRMIGSILTLCSHITPWLEAGVQTLGTCFHCWVCSWNVPSAIQMAKGGIWERTAREKPRKRQFLLNALFPLFGLGLTRYACLDGPQVSGLGPPWLVQTNCLISAKVYAPKDLLVSKVLSLKTLALPCYPPKTIFGVFLE